jgi:hypothetical protein
MIGMISLLSGQVYLWEEDFDPDPGNWTLDSHWSITSGYLQFYWSPTQTDYNMSATSPPITLPGNAGDLHVTQFANYYTSYVDEAFEIAVLVDGTAHVLWTHDNGIDWGSDGGELLTLSLIPFQNQIIQLRFRSWGTSTWNINHWRIYHLGIEGSYNDDLAALSIDGPVSPSVGEPAEYTITIANYGMNTQSNYTVKLMKHDNIELDTAAGTPIEQGETEEFVLTWTPGEEGAAILYGEVVLAGDEVPDNNTTPFLNVYVGDSLSGTYEINPDGTGDFMSFSSAMSTLSLVGVDGPTVFQVAPGVYQEQLLIGNIPGTSSDNPITFTGSGDDPAAIVLSYEPDDTNIRHLIKLDGAKHLRFNNMTFTIGENAGFGFNFHIQNQSEDIQITNNVFNNIQTTSSNYVHIVSSNSNVWTGTGHTVDNILISGNTFNDGYAALRLNGESANHLMDVEISDNVINNAYYHGFYLNYIHAPMVTGNTINIRSETPTTTLGSGIWLNHVHGPFLVSKNIIRHPGQYGIYFSNGETLADQRSQIVNNMIGGGFRNTGAFGGGIRILGTVSNLDIVFNSLNVDVGNGAALNIRVSTVTDLDIRNNSFAYTAGGTGYAIYIDSTNTPYMMNNNNYFSNGDNFVYYGLALADLSALQNTNMPPGNDTESRQGDPMYVSMTDLHAQGMQLFGGGVPIPGIDDDIDGEPRDPNTPCIGADEYVPLTEDLAAVSISGPGMGSVGELLEFQIAVQNAGISDQGSYMVKLMQAPDMELATIQIDVPLPAGDEALHTLEWTPAVTGSFELYGRVELAGDQNPDNDETDATMITIFPQDMDIINIGDGVTTVNYIPFNFYYRNSVTQTIYMENEINVAEGTILSISYYNSFSSNLTNMPIRIWMGNTTQANLTDGWVNAGQLEMVFDGNIDLPGGENSIIIPLDPVFQYTGGNLIIMAERPMDTVYYSSSDHFYYTDTPAYPDRTRYARTDTVTSPFDPYDMTDGLGPNTEAPNITLFIGDDAPPPVLYPPENLTAAAGDAVVNLDWDVPDMPVVRAVNRRAAERNAIQNSSLRLELLGFNVYRDDVMINADLVTETEFEDTDVVNDVTYSYYVTAVYDLGESDPSNTVEATPETAISPNPTVAHSPIPEDEAMEVAIDTPIGWTYTSDPLFTDPIGFIVNMWTGDTNDDPYQAYIEGGPGDHYFEEHPFAFDYDITYYWQVIPTTDAPVRYADNLTRASKRNSLQRGDAEDCPIWSFTTEAEPEAYPPENLTYEIQALDVHLMWDAPGTSGGTTEELIYDNDGATTGAYSYNGFTMATQMSPSEACQILTLRYFTTIQAGDNEFNAEVYNWAGTEPGTDVLFTALTAAADEEWIDVDVSGENILVDGDFVVGFGSINSTTFLGYDGDLNNGRSWDFDATSQTWGSWTEAYLIRAVVLYPDGRIAEIAPVTYRTSRAPEIQVSEKSSVALSGVYPAPAATRELIGYNVYRDDVMLNTDPVTETEYLDQELATGSYVYYVTALYDFGESEPSNEVNVVITTTDDVTSVPYVTGLQRNYPNPFNPETTISFTLQEADHVTVEIFNTRGQRVKTLVNEHREAGEHQLLWNGRDDSDREIASGIYFYRMKSGRYTSTKKMLMMK